MLAKLGAMPNSIPIHFSQLLAKGFQIEFHSHAEAILSVDFPDVLADLEATLVNLSIPVEEIIAGGGGEAKGTQRLRRALHARKWTKKKFVIEKTINDRKHESISHEIDHVREFPLGSIALEIEWNNKDPFLDRDLENFKRLHADGAISAGIIITRGESLQEKMRALVRRFVDERNIGALNDLKNWGYDPTDKQRKAIESQMIKKGNPTTFADAFVGKFVSDKFGKATTHWRKLEDRVRRGVGNPCPLLLIGLPASIVTFGEGKTALEEVLKEEEPETGDLFDR
jgi:hypothetical protein